MPNFLETMIQTLGTQAGAANRARSANQQMEMEMMMKGFRPPSVTPEVDPLQEAIAGAGAAGPQLEAVPGEEGMIGQMGPSENMAQAQDTGAGFGPTMPDVPMEPEAGPSIMDTLMGMFAPQQPTDFSQWEPSSVHPEMAAMERLKFDAAAKEDLARMRIIADAENYRKLNESKERLAKIDWASKRDLAYVQKALNWELDQSLMQYRTDMTALERQKVAQDFSKGVMTAMNNAKRLEFDMQKYLNDPNKTLQHLQAIAQEAELVDNMYAKIWGIKVDSGLGKWIARWTNPAYAKALDQLGQIGANAYDLHHQALKGQAEATPGTGAYNSRFAVGQAMEEDDQLAETAKGLDEDDLSSGSTMLGLVDLGGAALPPPTPGQGPLEHPITGRLREMNQAAGIR